MTTLNGLVGIDFNLAVTVASTSLSSQEAVLIHEFLDGASHRLLSSRRCGRMNEGMDGGLAVSIRSLVRRVVAAHVQGRPQIEVVAQ